MSCHINISCLLQLLDDVLSLNRIFDEGLALLLVSADQSLCFQVFENLLNLLRGKIILLSMFYKFGFGAVGIRIFRGFCGPHVDDPPEDLLLPCAQVLLRQLSVIQIKSLLYEVLGSWDLKSLPFGIWMRAFCRGCHPILPPMSLLFLAFSHLAEMLFAPRRILSKLRPIASTQPDRTSLEGTVIFCVCSGIISLPKFSAVMLLMRLTAYFPFEGEIIDHPIIGASATTYSPGIKS